MNSESGYAKSEGATDPAEGGAAHASQKRAQTQRPQYRCKVCSYTWMARRSRKSSGDAETYAKPRICPGCHSILWDREDVVKRTCKRCGYTWFSSMNPNRCPQCRTHRWNEDRNPCKCNFCGYTWERKVDKMPKTCPNCKRFVWNEPTEEHACVKCGTRFAVRVNVLGRCPGCGSVCYHCVCRECGHKWEDVSGKHPRTCPSCGALFKDPKRSEMRRGASKKRAEFREGDEKAIEMLRAGAEPMEVVLKTGLSFERIRTLKARLDERSPCSKRIGSPAGPSFSRRYGYIRSDSWSRMAKRDLISVVDMKDKWAEMVDLAIKLKAERGHHGDPLKGKTLAMIFEKPSTRTRISFDVAITELGGHALYIDESKMQMGVHSETVEDTARVMSRFVHGIMYRAYDYKMMDKFGEYATCPVISGLDNLEHPCQALADMVTIKEKLGGFRGKKLVYLGDGNNVCNSLLYAAAIMGIDMVACCPAVRMPNAEIMWNATKIAEENGSKIIASHEPEKACEGADVLYTDTWISMGDTTPEAEAVKLFQAYQINDRLLSIAKPGCIVMHCLPAHRGQEVTAEVMDGPHSVVFDQAENRLHAQKAVLYTLLKD